ncbi:MAG: hypothetical protein GXP48_09690 [Acidobacteria bacterium]|nr:hypothetical protein [Acidobacteriota bacterium]
MRNIDSVKVVMVVVGMICIASFVQAGKSHLVIRAVPKAQVQGPGGGSVRFRDLKKAKRELTAMIAKEGGTADSVDKYMEERIRRAQKQIEALRRANIDPGRYYDDRYTWIDDLLSAWRGVKLVESGLEVPAFVSFTNKEGERYVKFVESGLEVPASSLSVDVQGDVFDSRGRLLSSLVIRNTCGDGSASTRVAGGSSRIVSDCGPYDCTKGGNTVPVKFWFRVNKDTVAVGLIINFVSEGMHAPAYGCVKLALWTVGPDGKAVLSRVYAIAGDAFPKFRDNAGLFLADVDGDGNQDVVVAKDRYPYYHVNLKTGFGCVKEQSKNVYQVLRFSPKSRKFEEDDSLVASVRATPDRNWEQPTISFDDYDEGFFTAITPGHEVCDK